MAGKIKVLFVCIENSCRSQMAEGFARSLGGEALEAYSAGSKPGVAVNPNAIKVMSESGIDISGNKPKGYADLKDKEFDYVITMGCQETCPFIPGKKHIDWSIADPKGKDIGFFREVRDEIEKKIEEFIKMAKER